MTWECKVGLFGLEEVSEARSSVHSNKSSGSKRLDSFYITSEQLLASHWVCSIELVSRRYSGSTWKPFKVKMMKHDAVHSQMHFIFIIIIIIKFVLFHFLSVYIISVFVFLLVCLYYRHFAFGKRNLGIEIKWIELNYCQHESLQKQWIYNFITTCQIYNFTHARILWLLIFGGGFWICASLAISTSHEAS